MLLVLQGKNAMEERANLVECTRGILLHVTAWAIGAVIRENLGG